VSDRGVEVNSYRVGVSVTLYLRLFDDAVEADRTIRPVKGPSAQEPGEPLLTVTGTPDSPAYRRTWRVPVPSSGASLAATEAAPRVQPALPPLPEPMAPATIVEPPAAGFPSVIGVGSDGHVVVGNVLARRVVLRLNAHRAADEAEIELPLEALPFPPDGSVLRSILVEVRRGVVSADDWAEAMSSGAVAADGSPLTVPLATDSDEPDFTGFVDLHRLHAGSTGATTVTLTARDMAGVLADAQVRGRKIDNDAPADEAIATFLSLLPAAVGLDVVWRGPGDPPTLGAAAPKAKTTKKGKTIPRASDVKGSYLDAICDYCTMAGVVPTFRGYRLELAAPDTLDQWSAGDVNRMVYGSNIEDLELEHRMAGASAKAVEVRSFDPDTGKVVAARYPEDAAREGAQEPGALNAAAPSGPINIPPGSSAVDEKSPIVQFVRGVKDVARLRDIATQVFKETARQELSGRLVTKDLSTVEGRGAGVADLLALRAGDPLTIIVAPPTEAAAGSFLQRLARLPFADASALLVRSGYEREVANRLVVQIISARRPLVYRVRAVLFTWTIDAGTQTEVQFINYIEAIDKELREGRPELRTTNANRRRVALSGGSYVAQWEAIEQDMLAGGISPAEAERLKRQVGEAERLARARERGDDPATAPRAPARQTTSATGAPTPPRGFTSGRGGLGFSIGGF